MTRWTGALGALALSLVAGTALAQGRTTVCDPQGVNCLRPNPDGSMPSGGPLTPTDRGGAISGAGVSTAVAPANPLRRALVIQNPCAALENLTVSSTGAAVTPAAAGDDADLAPCATWTAGQFGGVNTAAVSVNAATAGHKFLAKELVAVAPVAPQTVFVAAQPTLAPTAQTNQVTLTWADGLTNGAPITGHNLYEGSAPGGETLLTTLTQAPPYTVKGLAAGTPVYFQISALNAAGESARSAEVTATPRAPAGGNPTPPPPLGGAILIGIVGNSQAGNVTTPSSNPPNSIDVYNNPKVLIWANAAPSGSSPSYALQNYQIGQNSDPGQPAGSTNSKYSYEAAIGRLLAAQGYTVIFWKDYLYGSNWGMTTHDGTDGNPTSDWNAASPNANNLNFQGIAIHAAARAAAIAAGYTITDDIAMVSGDENDAQASTPTFWPYPTALNNLTASAAYMKANWGVSKVFRYRMLNYGSSASSVRPASEPVRAQGDIEASSSSSTIMVDITGASVAGTGGLHLDQNGQDTTGAAFVSAYLGQSSRVAPTLGSLSRPVSFAAQGPDGQTVDTITPTNTPSPDIDCILTTNPNGHYAVGLVGGGLASPNTACQLQVVSGAAMTQGTTETPVMAVTNGVGTLSVSENVTVTAAQAATQVANSELTEDTSNTSYTTYNAGSMLTIAQSVAGVGCTTATSVTPTGGTTNGAVAYSATGVPSISNMGIGYASPPTVPPDSGGGCSTPAQATIGSVGYTYATASDTLGQTGISDIPASASRRPAMVTTGTVAHAAPQFSQATGSQAVLYLAPSTSYTNGLTPSSTNFALTYGFNMGTATGGLEPLVVVNTGGTTYQLGLQCNSANNTLVAVAPYTAGAIGTEATNGDCTPGNKNVVIEQFSNGTLTLFESVNGGALTQLTQGGFSGGALRSTVLPSSNTTGAGITQGGLVQLSATASNFTRSPWVNFAQENMTASERTYAAQTAYASFSK